MGFDIKMKEKTERKIQYIIDNWVNGNLKEAAKKVNSLTKIELFYLVSSNNKLACPSLIAAKNTVVRLENFVLQALEGGYK